MQSGFVQSDLEEAEKEDDLTDLDPASAQIPKAKVAEEVDKELCEPSDMGQGNCSVGIYRRHPWRASDTQAGFIVLGCCVDFAGEVIVG